MCVQPIQWGQIGFSLHTTHLLLTKIFGLIESLKIIESEPRIFFINRDITLKSINGNKKIISSCKRNNKESLIN